MTTLALLAASSMTSAATINIDFGRDDGTTPGNWNNLTGASGALIPADTTLELRDDTGAPTAIALAAAAPGAFAASGADYAGPYPAEVAALPATALMDSLFIRNATTTFTLSGLSAAETYDFLFYSARGGTADGKSLFTVTGGNGAFETSIGNVLNNSTDVATVSGVTADGAGQVTIAYTSDVAEGAPETGNAYKAGALNAMQIVSNPIPEPSGVLLVAWGAMGWAISRRW